MEDNDDDDDDSFDLMENEDLMKEEKDLYEWEEEIRIAIYSYLIYLIDEL